MEGVIGGILGDSIKLYALMTPPAVLSAFLGYSKNYDKRKKLQVALKTSLAVFIIGSILFIWGAKIFELFGFTLDAFRIGSGVLLMLTAIALMREDGKVRTAGTDGDISVVPLAVPLSMGPASIGAIMVMGAQAGTRAEMALGLLSLFFAAAGIYFLLGLADLIGRVLHDAGIAVLSRLTGLILAAIAAQVVFTGAVNFLE